ncbi:MULTISPECIES: glycosyltransferase family 4 protein [unclassified Pseudofrankia]|uniref:glycosyltransferase family 4 protein n=1 Tax=unclassified Pseudofrankia TaxID=2994372 RepID=UPI000AF53711|nr:MULTISPECIES: glycosyltransferase family 4 protein [unclassified Pseudofrankia]MDT3443970.1 glycosyltransferase family 4 protein [Pseudofrankia sp. BMG5.37]
MSPYSNAAGTPDDDPAVILGTTGPPRSLRDQAGTPAGRAKEDHFRTPFGPPAGGRDGARRPRVLLVTHYFPPEIGAPQARLSETARAWAASGLDVTVLTGMPNHPTGVVPPAYRGAVRRVEWVDGYRVVRTWLYATPNEGVVRKTLGHLSFMVSGVLLGAGIVGPADVVVVSSPTFFSLGSAWLLARLRRARLVVEVRDLWPAIFVQLGVITNRRVIAALERCELAAYQAADAVVTVTEGFRDDIVRRGIPATKVHVIPNGVDLERFRPAESETKPDAVSDPGDNGRRACEGGSFSHALWPSSDPGDNGRRPSRPAARETTRARLGARPADTLVVYIGAHGISQGLTAVADAAALLTDTPVRFAFVGDGADKERIAVHLAWLGLRNTTLAPAVPRDEVGSVLAAADICVVPLRAVPLFDTFIPSKMFEMLAAGRPVVGAVRGEAARILTAAGAVVVPPEDPAALADAIRALAADPARRTAMARAGRAYVAAHFDRARLADRYRRILLGLLGIPEPTAPAAVSDTDADRGEDEDIAVGLHEGLSDDAGIRPDDSGHRHDDIPGSTGDGPREEVGDGHRDGADDSLSEHDVDPPTAPTVLPDDPVEVPAARLPADEPPAKAGDRRTGRGRPRRR